MPIKLTLKKKITDRIWTAVGDFSSADGKLVGIPAEMLVKEMEKNHLQLILNAEHCVSRMNNREIDSYENVTPVKVTSVKVGTEVSFEKILVTLKKI